MKTLLTTARKATTAALAAFAGALGLALLDGNITGAETLVALGTGLVAGAGTYGIKNKPPE